MSDFTKAELIALEDAMENILLLHRPQNGKSPLLDKLQIMIDNYPEQHIEVCCEGEPGIDITFSYGQKVKCSKIRIKGSASGGCGIK